MTFRIWLVACFWALAGVARAQTTDPATRALIEKLQARIDGLERRLSELEKGPTARAAAAPQAAPGPAAHLAQHDAAPQAAQPVQGEHPAAAVYPALKTLATP